MFTLSKNLQKTKVAIREEILDLLRKQKEEDRFRKSLVLLEKLVKTPEFKRAKTILFYASFDREVETFSMMRRAQELGKRIALPVIFLKEKKIVPILVNNLKEDLEDGPYNIKQPRYEKIRVVNVRDLDLLIVPGVAFDRQNHRLGRGAGFYDRFLENLPEDTHTIGLAFDFQVVDCLPHQQHDISVSQVIVN